ncbi:GUN4 domain-containing protein [Coleofasciculus sp. FACHB-129]|uniref:GUN4 domain-containing protein n=1 Tax=Cyanophyceae TaxID=3028117 RepID=UPI001682B051|nr:GUN4 domain-containing protein [Coleofasciculus sp. FACHB-129]MBD1893195.1 GUN4 domain-containing protein [Coleofasciculus sp. FACHB-129]
MKILFLSANPLGTDNLDLTTEVRRIDEGLQRSKLRDQFQFIQKWEVNSDSLRRALLEENPDIVHFSGHGAGQAGLLLVDQDKQPKPVEGKALSGLFKHFSSVRCVLLNACYAEVQAKAIVQHIDYVVGMKQAVRDDAAIAFAVGFYDALGYGKSIDVAFELGCNAVQFELASFSSTTRSRKFIPVDFDKVEPLPDHLIPVLLKKERGSTKSLTSLSPSSSKANSLSEKLRRDDISEAEAHRIYRTRVQEFLADLQLTQIEKFQLAILAKVLGLPEADANRILQEEQDNQQHGTQPLTNRQSESGIDNVKNYLLAFLSLLVVSIGGFLIHTQTNVKYTQLQTLLQNKDWKSADDETARIIWEKAGRRQERSLRVEDFEKIPCSDLRNIDDLWAKHSRKHFGFSVQKGIWLSSDVNSDLGKFIERVGWGELKEDGLFTYWYMDGQLFDLSIPKGKLPWAMTFHKGNNETRKSYMAKLINCLP